MNPAASQLLPESFESELRRISLRHSPPPIRRTTISQNDAAVQLLPASSEPLLFRTPPCHNPSHDPLKTCSSLPQRATTLPRIVAHAAAQHVIALQLVTESVEPVHVGTAAPQLLPESFDLIVLIPPLRRNSCQNPLTSCLPVPRCVTTSARLF